MRSTIFLRLLLGAWCLTVPTLAPAGTPIIYCTDLFHPHEDPDDHFDLVTLLSLAELEPKAILLDQGRRQLEQPGTIPLRQALQLYGKTLPVAAGLADKLRAPTDDGRNQPEEFQGAVDLLVKVLSSAPEPVMVFATGSVRDVCAAWNRQPDLLRQKVSRLYLNIGNADPSGSEYNVDLDAQAYRGIMRAGLPVYLCPCLPMSRDGSNAVHSTWWKFRQAEVLATASPGLRNFFIYALQRTAPAELDPMQALSADLRAWHRLVWQMDRNMWCTGPLLHAAGRSVRQSGGRWQADAAQSSSSPGANAVFTFVPAHVEVDERGRTWIRENAPNPNVQLFRLLRPADYGPAMRDCLRELLRNSTAPQ